MAGLLYIKAVLFITDQAKEKENIYEKQIAGFITGLYTGA